MLGAKRKRERTKPRMVWRISSAAPLGQLVDVASPVEAPVLRPPAEPTPPGWAMSSFELLHGVEITEEDPSTVPAELIDELFNKKPPS